MNGSNNSSTCNEVATLNHGVRGKQHTFCLSNDMISYRMVVPQKRNCFVSSCFCGQMVNQTLNYLEGQKIN